MTSCTKKCPFPKNIVYSYRMFYSLFCSRKKEMFKIILSDFAFFIIFSTTFYFFSKKLIEYIGDLDLMMMLSTMTPRTVGEANVSVETMQSFVSNFPTEMFYEKFFIALKIFLALIAVTTLLWIIFKGYSWKKTSALLGIKGQWKENELGNFYLNFSLATALCFLFSMLLIVIGVKLSSLNMFMLFEFVMSTFMKIAVGIILVFVFYFGAVSYCFCSEGNLFSVLKKTFVVGTKKFPLFFTTFIFVLLKVYIAVLVVENSVLIAFWLPIVFFVFLFLPVTAWGRIAMLNVTNNYEKLKKRE